MSVKLLTEQHLEFLILKGDCTGCSESTLVKMPHCWKSHAQMTFTNLAYWVILHAFLSSHFSDFFEFFSKNSYRNTSRVSNSLGPDQAQPLVEPGLAPNFAKVISRRHKWTMWARAFKMKSLVNPGSAVVECLTKDWGFVGSSLTGITALCPWARNINPCLVLVQPRKTHPHITEKLLIGM